MTSQVRTLSPDDWELWRDVRLRSLADAPDAFASTLARERRFSEEDWRTRMVGPTVVVLEGADVVACGAAFSEDRETFHVVAMWTAPEARCRGHAQRVLAALATAAQDAGCRLVLDVTRGNEPARLLYERFGFVPTGEVRPLREGSALVVERMIRPGG